MKKLEERNIFNGLITSGIFVATYLILRLTGNYTGILNNPDNLISYTVLFEIAVFLYAALLVFLGAFYLYNTWPKQRLKPNYIAAVGIFLLAVLLASCYCCSHLL